MISIGSIVPIYDTVINLMNSPEVIERATLASSTVTKRGRTKEEIIANLIWSLAGEKAFLDYLRTLGYRVQDPPLMHFHYDGVVNDVLVDVKIRAEGKYWQQTPYEKRTIASTGAKVLYLCLDLMDDHFIFCGCAWVDELIAGNYDSPYAYTSMLKELDPSLTRVQKV